MSEGKFEWQEDQKEALGAEGDLVLTASAGTGKTTILAEKFTGQLLQLIEEQKRQDLDSAAESPLRRMVAITFTELAAAELKNKIREKLNALYEKNPDDRLLPLMRQLDAGYISTIHGFCRRLLRENFLEAGLSPGFGILTDDDASELQDEAATEALHQILQKDDFLTALALRFGFGGLKRELIALADKLRTDGYSRIDPEEVLGRFRELWVEAVKKFLSSLESVLAEMHNFLSDAHSGKAGVNTSEKTEATLRLVTDCRHSLRSIFDEPTRILEESTIEPMEALHGIAHIRNKGFEGFKEHREALHRLWCGLKNKDPGELSSLVGIEADVPRMRSLMEAAQTYIEIYDEKKNQRELLDFDDLLLFARDLLKNDSVLARYRKQFELIYVDEFQDVNPLQREIVELLRGEDDGRSVVIVGDGKQSIYRFRGADVLSFHRIAEKIDTDGRRQIELETNFRSHPALIRTLNKLFSPLFYQDCAENRFQIEPAEMEAFHEGDPDEIRVEWIRMAEHSPQMEGTLIARSILQMRERGINKRNGEPLDFGDIAVLLATQTHLTHYEEALRRYSIPYVVIGGKGFFRQREIWDVVSYLKLIWFPQDDYSLATVLRSPLCLLSDETLYRLAENETLNGRDLFEKESPFAFPEEEEERFRILRDLLLRHRAGLDCLSVAEMIEDLLEETGYEAVLLARPGGDQLAANLRKLIEMARAYESRGVNSGLEFTLEIAGRLFEKDDEPQALLSGSEQHVRLLTIHKSKGLQFPAVIIPRLDYTGNRHDGPILYDGYSGMGVKSINPDSGKQEKSPSWRLVSDSIQRQLDAEHLRLLYVAMTRAQEQVVLIGRQEPQTARYLQPWERRLSELLPDPEAAEKIGIRMRFVDEVGRFERDRRALAEEHEEIIRLQRIDKPETESNLEAAGRVVAAALELKPYTSKSLAYGVRELIELLDPSAGWDYTGTDLFENLPGEGEDFGEESHAVSPPTANPVDAGLAVHRYLEAEDYKAPPFAKAITARLTQFGLAEGAAVAAGRIERWLQTDEARRIASARKLIPEAPFTIRLDLRGENGDGIELLLSGAIDLLVLEDGQGPWLIDYKYSEFHGQEKHKLQLRLYHLALSRIPGMKPGRMTLVYLKDTHIETVAVTDEGQNDLQQRIFAKIYHALRPTGAAQESRP